MKIAEKNKFIKLNGDNKKVGNPFNHGAMEI